jgi:hypothetical protein
MADDHGGILLSAFVGPETVPLQVADELGLFAAQGIAVRCLATPSSIRQMTGLIDGDYHMASTAIDNVIAYDAGQGAAPTRRPADIVAFLGSATDPRRLVVGPEIAGFAALRGARIAVDAPQTGFSYLLHAMLARHGGLAPADYTLVPAGNMDARLAALRSGDCVAALLGSEHAGQALAVGFIRAVLAAVDWTLDPANAAALPAMIGRHLPGLGADACAAAAAALLSPGSVLRRGLPVSLPGTRTVLVPARPLRHAGAAAGAARGLCGSVVLRGSGAAGAAVTAPTTAFTEAGIRRAYLRQLYRPTATALPRRGRVFAKNPLCSDTCR